MVVGLGKFQFISGSTRTLDIYFEVYNSMVSLMHQWIIICFVNSVILFDCSVNNVLGVLFYETAWAVFRGLWFRHGLLCHWRLITWASASSCWLGIVRKVCENCLLSHFLYLPWLNKFGTPTNSHQRTPLFCAATRQDTAFIFVCSNTYTMLLHVSDKRINERIDHHHSWPWSYYYW